MTTIASGPARQQRRPSGLKGLAPLFLVLLAAAGPARAADPLDGRATDWRPADWRALDEDERHWVVAGFSLGWRGLAKAEGQLRRRPEPDLTAPRRALLAKAPAGTRLAILLLTAERDHPLPPLAVTGETWIALDARPRLALLQGFYAGVTAAALDRALDGTRDPARLDAAFAEARRRVRPRLALAPSLLFARLSDWLFYTDRRAAPLVETIAVLAEQIKGG